MLRTAFAVLSIGLVPVVVTADELKVAAGVAGSYMNATERALGSRTSVGPFVRLVPRDGFGPAWGLTWFESRFDLAEIGGPAVDGKLNIRPVMAGVSYTAAGEKVAVSVSFVGGYAFNRLRLNDDSRRGPGNARIENSPAYRPGVSLWHSLNSRLALTMFGGYVIARPTVKLELGDVTVERRLKADYAVASVGLAVVVF